MEPNHKCIEALEALEKYCFYCIPVKDLPLCSDCRKNIILSKKNFCERCLKETILHNKLKGDYFNESVADERIFEDLSRYFSGIPEENKDAKLIKISPPVDNRDESTKSVSLDGISVKEGSMNESDKSYNASSSDSNTKTYGTIASSNVPLKKNATRECDIEESQFTA
ncbi:hypothetical protein SteCoe_36502 [Stentor coeruleus]|uniref:Uncharacterized protein n=1 Tax=Stentor coeruleus TaxID=5963 RepID=A0A1R2APY2_9CILI|nr:hypothetical protein SteCoe_36502 [Stentor coeruleus]